MAVMKNLRLRLSSFCADRTGSMPIEGVMAATFLIWWYIASFQFFDAYRQKNVNLKAAYTIADLISRKDEVDPAYVTGLNKIFDYLTYSRKPTEVRVTSVGWDTTTNAYMVKWSYATGTRPIQTDATINTVANRIPNMAPNDTTVLVETYMAYEPIFSVGLNAQWYNTFITTRPRWNSCVSWDDGLGNSTGC